MFLGRRGGGVVFRAFQYLQKSFKNHQICSKKFFKLLFDVCTLRIEHLPTDVSTHTSKTQQLFTWYTCIAPWMSSKDTQRGPQCPLEFAEPWGFPKTLGVPGSVLGGPGGRFRGRGPVGGHRGWGPDGGLRGGPCWCGGWGLAGRLVCLCWGGLLCCFSPPSCGLLPLLRGCVYSSTTTQLCRVAPDPHRGRL